MRSCSGVKPKSICPLDHRALFPELGNLAVIEAELDQDLARVLAEPGRAAANAPAPAAVRPHRELGMTALHRLALDELRVLRCLAWRDAKVHRHIVLVA